MRFPVNITSLLACLLLVACEQQTTAIPAPASASMGTPASANDGQTPLARIAGQNLTQGQLDRDLQLALFDLDWQAYRLRLARIEQLIEHSDPDGNHSEIMLKPPMPPRLSVPLDKRPVRGNADAPLLLQVFCSYQSPHCGRLNDILLELDSLYPYAIRQVFYDFPLGFHRQGKLAATAVRCAGEQQSPWEYHDAVYAGQDRLTRERFGTIAAQLSLKPQAFESCLNAGQYESNIQADIRLAQSLGLTKVPVVLINGLYLPGPQPVAIYRYFIEEELTRLGVAPPQTMEALIAEEPAEPESAQPRVDRVRDPSARKPPQSKMVLSRQWLDEQLQRQQELAAYLRPAEHLVEGHALLKLGDVSGDAFYQTLGLETGDVIMRVGDAWMHADQVPLWDELRQQDALTLILMRKGRPVQYSYKIKD